MIIYAAKMSTFIKAVNGLEESNNPITYYKLKNLNYALSPQFIRMALSFCLAFALISRYEIKEDNRTSFHYKKTPLWYLLEDYIKNIRSM